MRVLVAVVLLTVLLSGCQEAASEPPSFYVAAADEAYAAMGEAPDGRGVVQWSDGLLVMSVNATSRAGLITATGRYNANAWRINFTKIEGVMRDAEVGAGTGRGDPCQPRANADLAAWGTAEFFLDGRLFKDPIAKLDNWSAYVSVLRAGIRDDARRAYAGGGSSVCSAAQGASPIPNDAEVHLQLRNRSGAFVVKRLYHEQAHSPAAEALWYFESHPFQVRDPNIVARVFVNASAPVTLAASSFNVEVRRGDHGGLLKRWRLDSEPADHANLLADVLLDAPGEYAIVIQGRAVGVTYTMDVIEVSQTSLYNLWFEHVEWGDAAQKLGRAILAPKPVEENADEDWGLD